MNTSINLLRQQQQLTLWLGIFYLFCFHQGALPCRNNDHSYLQQPGINRKNNFIYCAGNLCRGNGDKNKINYESEKNSDDDDCNHKMKNRFGVSTTTNRLENSPNSISVHNYTALNNNRESKANNIENLFLERDFTAPASSPTPQTPFLQPLFRSSSSKELHLLSPLSSVPFSFLSNPHTKLTAQFTATTSHFQQYSTTQKHRKKKLLTDADVSKNGPQQSIHSPPLLPQTLEAAHGIERTAKKNKRSAVAIKKSMATTMRMMMSQSDDVMPNQTTLRRNHVVLNSVTFETQPSFLLLKHKLYGLFDISLKIRTLSDTATLMYAGGSDGKDFLALELSDGHPIYTFDVGAGPRTLSTDSLTTPPTSPGERDGMLRSKPVFSNNAPPKDSRTPAGSFSAEQRLTQECNRALNDGEWHQIRIYRQNLTTHWMSIDVTCLYHDNLPALKSVYYDLNDEWLYFGGAPKLASKLVRSGGKGFRGCMGDVVVDGVELKEMKEQGRVILVQKFKSQIKEGCAEQRNVCTDDGDSRRCLNGGVCVPLWSDFACDCSFTAHAGKLCQEETTTFSFKRPGGLLLLNRQTSSQHHSTSDTLVVGFKLPPLILQQVLARKVVDNSKQHFQHRATASFNSPQQPPFHGSPPDQAAFSPRKVEILSNKSSNSNLSPPLRTSILSTSSSSSSSSSANTSKYFPNKPIFSKSTLFFLNSSTSNDFLEISLTLDFVEAAYNLGSSTNILNVSLPAYIKKNGALNVVTFTRNSQNSTLRLNLSPPSSLHPSGNQHTSFNHQHYIHVGAKGKRSKDVKLISSDKHTKKAKENIKKDRNDKNHPTVMNKKSDNSIGEPFENSFIGNISGVVFNGVSVLDAVLADHAKSIFGSVSLLSRGRQPQHDDVLITTKPYFSFNSSYPLKMDDSFSGEMCAEDVGDDERVECVRSSRPNDVKNPKHIVKCLYDDADCSNNRNSNDNNSNIPFETLPSRSINPNLPHFRDIFSSSHSTSFSFDPVFPPPDSSSEHRQDTLKTRYVDKNVGFAYKTTRFPGLPSSRSTSNTSTSTADDWPLSNIFSLIILFITCLVLITLVSSLSWLIYRCRSKQQGTYKLDAPETSYCTGASSLPLTCSSSKNPSKHKETKLKKTTSREWYV